MMGSGAGKVQRSVLEKVGRAEQWLLELAARRSIPTSTRGIRCESTIRHSALRMNTHWTQQALMPEKTEERARRGVDKRRLILDSAVKVFADKGYDGTRISDIARDAEIAYGLVYHYFKNKEEILDTIFLERWGEFIEEIEAISAARIGIEEKLFRIARVIARAYSTRADWAKVLVFEIQRSQRLADPVRLQSIGCLFQRIAELLRSGQERGELRSDVDPELACYIFVGGLDIVVTSRVLDLLPLAGKLGAAEGGAGGGDSGGGGEEQGDAPDDAFSEKLARTVVELFLNGMCRSDAMGE